jgi:hypothetical protein
MYTVSVKNKTYSNIDAENSNEAIQMATDLYYAETGKLAYTEDAHVQETND